MVKKSQVSPAEIIRGLEKIVGRENVASSTVDLLAYTRDAGPMEGVLPLAVVKVGDYSECSRVLRLANELGFKVYVRGGGTSMNPARLWLVYLLYLLSSVVVFSWYDSTFIAAVHRISKDSAGNIVFTYDGAPIYPFTVAAAVLGVSATTYYIWRMVGGIRGILLGLLVGRAATLAVFEMYEFTFTGLGTIFYGWPSWGENYFAHMDWFLLKVSYIGTLTPWVKRKNLISAYVALLIAMLVFLAWVITGYRLPDSGDFVAYYLNSATRLLFALIPVVLVKK
ncbi:MAG: hypothetical protein QXQ48_03820 [Nitrososphaerota archaeon]